MLIYIRKFDFFSDDTALSQMNWFQKAAGTIQSLGGYIPISFLASALLLPFAAWGTLEFPSDRVSESALSLFKWLFISAYVSQKLHLHLVYGHLGSSTVRRLKLTSIWISPCKPIAPKTNRTPCFFSKKKKKKKKPAKCGFSPSTHTADVCPHR